MKRSYDCRVDKFDCILVNTALQDKSYSQVLRIHGVLLKNKTIRSKFFIINLLSTLNQVLTKTSFSRTLKLKCSVISLST